MGSLLEQFMVNLEFGGIPTSEAKSGIKRCKQGGMLTGEQLRALAKLTIGVSKIVTSVRLGIQKMADSHDSDALLSIIDRLRILGNLDQGIARQIYSAIEEESGAIRDNASDQLQKARYKMRSLESKIKQILKGMNGEITTRNNRFCVVRPLDDFGGAQPKGVVVLGQQPGGQYIYLEPQHTVQLNNDLAAARGEAYGAEESILWKLTGSCLEQVDEIQSCLNIVVDLDCMVARWKYTQWIGGTLPEFVSFAGVNRGEKEFQMSLQQLKHPLLYSQHLKSKQSQLQRKRNSKLGRRLQNRKVEAGEEKEGKKSEAVPSPVPINVCVGNKIRCVIVTGPNTGGKTACLKAVGLSILMGKAGLGICAIPPIYFPPFSSVLADIGDEQSLSANLSTFSGHLKRIKEIRQEADGKCLVLLDEVGTGTDPTEGSALGIALLQTLAKGGIGGSALTMATSHHTPLTALKYQNPIFENASMEFDDEKLAPTYRLLWGIPGRSNALNICERLGMPEDILQDAMDRLGERQATIETSVEQLEDIQRKQELQQQKNSQLKKQIQDLQFRKKELATKLQVAQVNARKKQQEDMKLLLKKTRQQIRLISNQLLQEDKVKRKQESPAKKELEGQNKIQENTGKSEQGTQVQSTKQLLQQLQSDWVPEVGDEVYVPRLRSNARIMKISKKGDLELQTRMMRMKALVDEVQPI